MVRMISVKNTIWSFYEAMEADSKEGMADYFETLHCYYKRRGRKIKELREEKEAIIKYDT